MKKIYKTREYYDEAQEKHKVKDCYYQIYSGLFWAFIFFAFFAGAILFSMDGVNKEDLNEINTTLQVTKTELSSCNYAKWGYQTDIQECKSTLKLQDAMIDECFRRLGGNK